MPTYFDSTVALKKLKMFFSLDYDLVRFGFGFCPRIPGYTDKCQFIRHLYEDFKRIRSIRERIQDFGVPYPEKQLDPAWTNLVKHLMTAENENFFFAGLYRVIKKEQAHAFRTYVNSSLRLNDAPSIEALEDHLPVLDKQIAWGKQFLEAGKMSCLEEKKIEAFEQELTKQIHDLGNLYEGISTREAIGIPQYPEYEMPEEMELESRFLWRSAEQIFDGIDNAYAATDENLAHHSYIHFTELPVVDICASFVYDGRHMPFEYIADFARQTWDEARHSQMGFSRLTSMGIDPYSLAIPVGVYKAYLKNPLLDRIAALTQVGEACSFVPKKKWKKAAEQLGDILTSLEYDFDVVDEKNHVKFGTKWLKDMIERSKETRDFNQIVSDSEFTIRSTINEVKKEKGEKWLADLGPRFISCQDSESPLNLAPKLFA